MFSGIGALGALWVMVRRGSDRENRRAAEVAVTVVKDETVTPINPAERERGVQ